MSAPVGVVLAGGGSRRMGRDKAGLELAGRSLAERAAAALAPVCSEVLFAGGAASRRGPAGTVAIADGPGAGPAAGILGGAAARPGSSLLVLACDLPGVTSELLAELAGLAPEADLVLPRSARGPEPLVARYGPRALAALADRVASGELAVRGLLGVPELAVAWLEGEELARFGDPAATLANLNTPEDLARWATPP